MLQRVKGFRLPRTCLHLATLFYFCFWCLYIYVCELFFFYGYYFQAQFQWLSIHSDFSMLPLFSLYPVYWLLFADLKFQCTEEEKKNIRSFHRFFFSLHSIVFASCTSQTEAYMNCERRESAQKSNRINIHSKSREEKKIKELTKSQVFIYNVLPYIPLLFFLFFESFVVQILYRYCFLFFKYLFLFWFFALVLCDGIVVPVVGMWMLVVFFVRFNRHTNTHALRE